MDPEALAEALRTIQRAPLIARLERAYGITGGELGDLEEDI